MSDWFKCSLRTDTNISWFEEALLHVWSYILEFCIKMIIVLPVGTLTREKGLSDDRVKSIRHSCDFIFSSSLN